MMIDNIERATELVEDMNANLPIPFRPTAELLQILKSKTFDLPSDGNWQIESVFYLGDEGGITCSIRFPRPNTEALLVSLTHLRVDYRHPLSQRIREYQSRRTKKLARRNAGARAKQIAPKRPSKQSGSQPKRRR